MNRTLSLVLAFAVIAGCNSKKKDTPTGGDPTTPAVTPGGGVPAGGTGTSNDLAYKGPAAALTSEFATYGQAQKKYGGKYVEVTAPIESLDMNPFGGGPELRLKLRGNSTDGELGYDPVLCSLTAKQTGGDPKMKPLTRGQSVTVRGKVQDAGDVSLSDCTVVAVGPLNAVPTTLSEIDNELGKEKVDLKRSDRRDMGKYKDKSVLVKVTIAAPGPVFKDGPVTFTAVAPKGAKRAFAFRGVEPGALDDKDAADLKSLKAGDTVLVLAQVTPTSGTASYELHNAYVLKSAPSGMTAPEEAK